MIRGLGRCNYSNQVEKLFFETLQILESKNDKFDV